MDKRHVCAAKSTRAHVGTAWREGASNPIPLRTSAWTPLTLREFVGTPERLRQAPITRGGERGSSRTEEPGAQRLSCTERAPRTAPERSARADQLISSDQIRSADEQISSRPARPARVAWKSGRGAGVYATLGRPSAGGDPVYYYDIK